MESVKVPVHRRLVTALSFCSRLLLLALVICAASYALFAQADRATIEGIVTDPSGAAIPDAKVNIVRIETNILIENRTAPAERRM